MLADTPASPLALRETIGEALCQQGAARKPRRVHEERTGTEAISLTGATHVHPLSRLLVFVDIFVEQPEMDRVVAALSKLENVVDLYEVTGEFDIVTLISVDDLEEFREVLHDRVMKIKGVRSTVSSIVLKVQKGPKGD